MAFSEQSRPAPNQPWLTYGMLAILAAILACEYIFAVTPPDGLTPSIQTILALGGLNRAVMQSSGEWYRIFTGPLLHSGVFHLFMNCAALIISGTVIEKLLGRFWLFAFFTVGALGGALASYFLNQSTITTVGASGAIMGLFAAMYFASRQLPAGIERKRLQTASLQTLITSVLPLAMPGMHIDYAAHLGGAISGGIVAWMCLKHLSQFPGLRKLAAGICITGVILFALGFIGVIHRYPLYKSIGEFAPQKIALQMRDGTLQDVSAQIEHYPHDPRLRLYAAQQFVEAGNVLAAQKELEIGLKDAVDMKSILGPLAEPTLRSMYAATLLDLGQPDKAKEIAKPLCLDPAEQEEIVKLRDAMKKNGLCE